MKEPFIKQFLSSMEQIEKWKRFLNEMKKSDETEFAKYKDLLTYLDGITENAHAQRKATLELNSETPQSKQYFEMGEKLVLLEKKREDLKNKINFLYKITTKEKINGFIADLKNNKTHDAEDIKKYSDFVDFLNDEKNFDEKSSWKVDKVKEFAKTCKHLTDYQDFYVQYTNLNDAGNVEGIVKFLVDKIEADEALESTFKKAKKLANFVNLLSAGEIEGLKKALKAREQAIVNLLGEKRRERTNLVKLLEEAERLNFIKEFNKKVQSWGSFSYWGNRVNGLLKSTYKIFDLVKNAIENTSDFVFSDWFKPVTEKFFTDVANLFLDLAEKLSGSDLKKWRPDGTIELGEVFTAKGITCLFGDLLDIGDAIYSAVKSGLKIRFALMSDQEKIHNLSKTGYVVHHVISGGINLAAAIITGGMLIGAFTVSAVVGPMLPLIGAVQSWLKTFHKLGNLHREHNKRTIKDDKVFDEKRKYYETKLIGKIDGIAFASLFLIGALISTTPAAPVFWAILGLAFLAHKLLNKFFGSDVKKNLVELKDKAFDVHTSDPDSDTNKKGWNFGSVLAAITTPSTWVYMIGGLIGYLGKAIKDLFNNNDPAPVFNNNSDYNDHLNTQEMRKKLDLNDPDDKAKKEETVVGGKTVVDQISLDVVYVPKQDDNNEKLFNPRPN